MMILFLENTIFLLAALKIINRNPIAEKAISELVSEILSFNPNLVEITNDTLALIFGVGCRLKFTE